MRDAGRGQETLNWACILPVGQIAITYGLGFDIRLYIAKWGQIRARVKSSPFKTRTHLWVMF
jgi:hypothetical protein